MILWFCVLKVIWQRGLLVLYCFEWLWAVSSTTEAKVCTGRLFPRGKRLEMHWACCHIVLPGVLFIRFILHCLVKNSSLCSSGLLQELPKSSSLQTLQKHLSPLMMWSMWLILEKWKRKGTGIHSSGLCDLGSCSMPWAAYFSFPKSWEKLEGT